jgi:hypothetical protein
MPVAVMIEADGSLLLFFNPVSPTLYFSPSIFY